MIMCGGRERPSRRGLSMMDTLIAFAITSIALAALMTAVPATFVATNQAAIRIQAIGAAQAYLDRIRQSVQGDGNASLPAAPVIGIDAGESMMGSGTVAKSLGAFTLTNNGCPPAGLSGVLFDCAVTVAWSQGIGSRSLTLETYVTRQ